MTINFSIIESIISNSCFLIVFLTTIYYWIKVIFFSKRSQIVLSQNNTIIRQRSDFSLKFGFLSFVISNFLLAIQLILRWFESGHFPLSSLYESLIFLTWGIIFFYIIIEYWLKSEFIGVFIAPIILLILGFTSFILPSELQQTKPLVPALQSNWLFMHVSVMMLSYASLLLGCLIAIGYLIVFFLEKQKSGTSLTAISRTENPIFEISNTRIENINNTPNINIELDKNQNVLKTPTSNAITASFLRSRNEMQDPITDVNFNKKILENKNWLNIFDNLSYRIIGIGFAFLTLGILSGAVWANETWGSYWSWDPKETWALITWLTFAIYLHTRFLNGWTGIKPASIATIGFFIIWICYLGVNFVGKGLHSYGFLTS